VHDLPEPGFTCKHLASVGKGVMYHAPCLAGVCRRGFVFPMHTGLTHFPAAAPCCRLNVRISELTSQLQAAQRQVEEVTQERDAALASQEQVCYTQAALLRLSVGWWPELVAAVC
jgi:hypothetical protein